MGKNPDVQKGAADTVASSLQSKAVLEATGDAIEPILQTQGLQRGLSAMARDERLVEPLVLQTGRLLADDRMVSSVAGFLQDTMERGEVKDALLLRAKSIIRDPTVHQAGAQGIRGALVPSFATTRQA